MGGSRAVACLLWSYRPKRLDLTLSIALGAADSHHLGPQGQRTRGTEP